MKENNSKKVFLAWLAFTAVILSSLIIDFTIRSTSEDFYNAGLSEIIWFGMHILSFVLLIALLPKSRDITTLLLKIIINGLLALTVYAIIVYTYVLGVGTNSL